MKDDKSENTNLNIHIIDYLLKSFYGSYLYFWEVINIFLITKNNLFFSCFARNRKINLQCYNTSHHQSVDCLEKLTNSLTWEIFFAAFRDKHIGFAQFLQKLSSTLIFLFLFNYGCNVVVVTNFPWEKRLFKYSGHSCISRVIYFTELRKAW